MVNSSFKAFPRDVLLALVVEQVGGLKLTLTLFKIVFIPLHLLHYIFRLINLDLVCLVLLVDFLEFLQFFTKIVHPTGARCRVFELLLASFLRSYGFFMGRVGGWLAIEELVATLWVSVDRRVFGQRARGVLQRSHPIKFDLNLRLLFHIFLQ